MLEPVSQNAQRVINGSRSPFQIRFLLIGGRFFVQASPICFLMILYNCQRLAFKII